MRALAAQGTACPTAPTATWRTPRESHVSHRVRARGLDLGSISGVSRRTSHGAYSEVSRVRARSTRSNGEACWPMNEMPRRNVSLQRRATSDCGARGDTWRVRRRGRDRYDLVSRHAIRILTVCNDVMTSLPAARATSARAGPSSTPPHSARSIRGSTRVTAGASHRASPLGA